jgi:quinol monooxygenase YgiN
MTRLDPTRGRENMASSFALVARFELHHEDAAGAFDELVEQTIADIRVREPGTLVYFAHTVPTEPMVRVFYELYEDQAAFDRHQEQPHTQYFLTEAEQHISALHVTFLHPGAGKAPWPSLPPTGLTDWETPNDCSDAG